MIRSFQKSFQHISLKQYGLKTVRIIHQFHHSYTLRFMSTMPVKNINEDNSKLDKLPILITKNSNNISYSNIISQYTTQVFNIIKNIPVSPSKSWEEILVLLQPAIDWAKDLWKGCKIFGKDLKYAHYIFMKQVEGYELSRYELMKLSRTRSDIIKFIPFILLCLIPGTCLLLPICLVVFPNMLPSSFETYDQRHNKHYRTYVIKSRISSPLLNEYKKLVEINIENKELKELIKNQKILEKDQMIRFSKDVDVIDKLLLQNMNYGQLTTLCKYFKMFSLYPQYILRLQLLRKMNSIKKDDKLMMRDGIESLTTYDLEDVCEMRGMKYEGMSKEKVRNMVQNWIDLSVNHFIPVSYLFF